MTDAKAVFDKAVALIQDAMQEPSALRRVELLEEGLRLNRRAFELKRDQGDRAPQQAQGS